MKRFMITLALFVGACSSTWAGLDLPHLRTQLAEEQTTGPAPKLTEVSIYAITSEAIDDWEYIQPWQTKTVNKHFGKITVAIFERGYGHLPLATINGNNIPRNKNIATDSICYDAFGNATTYCPTGSEIIGFMQFWDLSDYSVGDFTYRSTSINGGGSLSDSIEIQ